MSLPTLIKTWQFNVNQNIYGSSSEICANNFFLGFKNSLINFASSPWTVWGSSNSSSYNAGGGTDYWDDTDDLVHSTGAHSWIVLTSPNGCQYCMDLNDSNIYPEEASIIFSPQGLFTGGSTSNRPTATDEYVFYNKSDVIPTGNNTYKLHVMHSTDGYSTRSVLFINSNPVVFFMCDLPYNPISGWSNPVFVYNYSSSGAMGYTDFNDISALKTRIGTDNIGLYCTSEGFNSAAIGQNMLSSDDDTGEWPMLPMGLANTTSPHRGRKGELIDIWWGSTALASGTTYPDNTSRQFVQFGDIILPWNGSTPLLS